MDRVISKLICEYCKIDFKSGLLFLIMIFRFIYLYPIVIYSDGSYRKETNKEYSNSVTFVTFCGVCENR